MTGAQIVGVVMAAAPLLGLIVGSSWLMAREHGWWAPVVIWGGSVAFTGLVVGGMFLALGGAA